MYILEYLSTCPFSRTVILFMNELGIKYQLVNEPIYSKLSSIYQSDDIKCCSDYPKLFVDNELEIVGMNNILDYFCQLNSSNKTILIGDSLQSAIRCKNMMYWIDKELFENNLKPLLYEKIFKNYDLFARDRSPNSIVLREMEFRAKKYLLYMQSVLEKSDYLSGDKISVADFFLAANISILDYLNQIIWNLEFKRLKHWYCVIKSRTNFKTIASMKIQGFHAARQYAMVDF